MKAMMMFTAAAIVLFAVTAADAQSTNYFSSVTSCTKDKIVRAEKGFASCLASSNNGVVESAIAHVATVKLAMPEVEYAVIARRLESLAREGSTPGIRFKAYIATQLFENPSLFAMERNVDYADPDAMFAALTSRLQSTYFSANTK